MIQLIHYGRPTAGPPLLALPGLDGTVGSIEPVVQRLAQEREVIVVDFSAENNATLEQLVAEMATLLLREVPTPIDIMGQSIGTILAAQLAAWPGLTVRKVVLTCTFTRLRWTTLRWVAALTRLTPNWLYRLTSPHTIALSCGPVGDGRDHPAFAASRNSNKQAVARRTTWQIDRDFSADLRKIHVPVMILMGEKDRFVPDAAAECQKLRSLFAHHPAQIETIANAGHIFLPSTAVATATTKIEAFLQ
ncbi:MAG TPA: alpha/beta hydrolase [Chloroflexota bacterium]|nr:alpha/beta hydrolase [Chloroflexota bacterium]HUM70087.1 alpha/beta hydrolase [Chloroflexota bacterium]